MRSEKESVGRAIRVRKLAARCIVLRQIEARRRTHFHSRIYQLKPDFTAAISRRIQPVLKARVDESSVRDVVGRFRRKEMHVSLRDPRGGSSSSSSLIPAERDHFRASRLAAASAL